MDETTAAIQRGCRLARELEENLDNLANQPEILTRFCDEIIRVFSYVKEQISYSTMVHDHHHRHQEWRLRSGSSSSQPMDHHHHMLGAAQPAERQLGSGAAGGFDEPAVMTGLQVGDSDVQPMEVSNASRASSSSQRQRRRRDEGERRIERVPAPRMGNTEIPPDDGYTWRKYGQKDILNSNYPRSYFRCTHQKLYSCPAKKQVQRLDDDPNMFEVLYRGEHTCHLSSTAPSVPPPPSLQVRSQDLNLQPPADGGILHAPPPPPPDPLPGPSLSHWLSMDIIRPPLITGEGPSNLINTAAAAGGMQMYRDFSLLATTTAPAAVTCSSSRGGGGSGGAGPSSAATRLGDYQPVTDLADAMFNSGSSSNNSMDLIFPSITDDKWDSGEKK